MDCKERIQNILEQLFPICEAWIQDRDGQTYFVDPLDGEEISAHYGATHMAAALILYGKKNHRTDMYVKGENLLNSVLNRWGQTKRLYAFHFDFNNFALCVVEDVIKKDHVELAERIRHLVLQTHDSNHNTTNWLPMRWYVNKKRFEWSHDNKYLKKCSLCKSRIISATNADGGIEDRMPKGMSFNLQYNIATVGVLQFLRIKGVEYDLSKELAFLLNSVAPDGDINYQGRGTNQIFAWSLWIYLLASSSKENALCKAMDYLEHKVVGMYQRNNLMLNEWDGSEKYLWWDYHYCSVYSAHFVLWMVLSLLDYDKKTIADTKCNDINDTGLLVYKYDNAFVSVFSGRKEYLSERGPIINAIWYKKYGFITKASFGPWQGAFGQRYSNEFVLLNFLGLIEKCDIQNRIAFPFLKKILKKIGVKICEKRRVCPCPVVVKNEMNKLVISIVYNGKNKCYLNIPTMNEIGASEIQLLVDGIQVPITEIGKIKNQYGWNNLLQSATLFGRNWVLSFL